MQERLIEVDHSTLKSIDAQVCPAPGLAIPHAQTSGRIQLANGRDLYAGQRHLGTWEYLYSAVDKAGGRPRWTSC